MNAAVFSLLDLPHELLADETFLPFLSGDRTTLLSCAATSRTLRNICLPHIYSSVALSSPTLPPLLEENPEEMGMLDLEKLQDPALMICWEESSQARRFLTLLDACPQIASLVRTLRLVHGASGYEYPFWVLSDPSVPSLILERLVHLQSLELSLASDRRAVWTDMSWDVLPAQFTDAVFRTVNQCPSFRHLGIGIRFSFRNQLAFSKAFTIQPGSRIESLSLTTIFFDNTDQIMDTEESSLIQSPFASKPSLLSLELAFIEESVQGPLLIAALLHPSFPVNVQNLTRLSFIGLNCYDDWIGSFLDGQETDINLTEVVLGGIFRLRDLPFLTHFERFTHITSLTLATDYFKRPFNPYHSTAQSQSRVEPWSDWIGSHLPPSLRHNLLSFTLHTDASSYTWIERETFPHLMGVEDTLEKYCPQLKKLNLQVHKLEDTPLDQLPDFTMALASKLKGIFPRAAEKNDWCELDIQFNFLAPIPFSVPYKSNH